MKYSTFSLLILGAFVGILSSQAQHSAGPSETPEIETYSESAFWPPFVTLNTALFKPDGKTIKTGQRGTLQRVVSGKLIVDFGRHGLSEVSIADTDFAEQFSNLSKGLTSKEFSNLSLQIGNKLMRFTGDELGAIRFENVRDQKYFVLIYIDVFEASVAEALINLSDTYESLVNEQPNATGVVLPKSRKYYDLALGQKISIPFIAPHVRNGYRASLAHNPTEQPKIVSVDSNGKILYESSVTVLDDLPKVLGDAFEAIAEVDMDGK